MRGGLPGRSHDTSRASTDDLKQVEGVPACSQSTPTNSDQADSDDDGIGDDCEEADTEDPDTDTEDPDADTEDPDIDDTGLDTGTAQGGACGCSSTGTPAGALGLIGLMGLVLRRRRR